MLSAIYKRIARKGIGNVKIQVSIAIPSDQKITLKWKKFANGLMSLEFTILIIRRVTQIGGSVTAEQGPLPARRPGS